LRKTAGSSIGKGPASFFFGFEVGILEDIDERRDDVTVEGKVSPPSGSVWVERRIR
jgi:hypothetical protein